MPEAHSGERENDAESRRDIKARRSEPAPKEAQRTQKLIRFGRQDLPCKFGLRLSFDPAASTFYFLPSTLLP